jgi:hypothetical protein
MRPNKPCFVSQAGLLHGALVFSATEMISSVQGSAMVWQLTGL